MSSMYSLVLSLAVATVAAAGDVLVGPSSPIPEGQACWLTIKAKDLGEDPQFRCDVLPENDGWVAAKSFSGDGLILFTRTSPPGVYVFAFATILDGRVIIDQCRVVVSGSGPNPPVPPPEPGPQPPEPPSPHLGALGTFSRDKARELVPQVDLLKRTAPALAASYKRMALKLDDYSTTDEWLDAIRESNNAALGSDAGAWEEWRIALATKIGNMEEAGQWKRKDYTPGYLDVASGLLEAAK